jgi:hypothetical protein
VPEGHHPYAYEKFPQPTKAVNELWQTDFTFFKVVRWGWYYLSTIITVLRGLRIRSAYLWIIITTIGNYERDLEILERRKQIKQNTMLLQRKQNRSLLLAENTGKVYIGAEALS